MLTKTNIKKYQERLEKIKLKLQKEIKEDEKAPNFGKDFERPEERAEEAEAEFTSLSLAEEFRERLEDVQNALNKIIKNKYGVCEKCGKEIETKILDIDPESRFCKACKK